MASYHRYLVDVIASVCSVAGDPEGLDPEDLVDAFKYLYITIDALLDRSKSSADDGEDDIPKKLALDVRCVIVF